MRIIKYCNQRGCLKNIPVLIMSLACLFFAGDVKSQNKKQITDSVYDLWGKLFLKNSSEDAKWISYTVNFPKNKDTLFVKNTETGVNHAIPKGYGGLFNAKGWFAVHHPGGITLIHLDSGKREVLTNATAYAFTNSGNEFVYSYKDNNKVGFLEVRKLNDTLKLKIEGVNKFKMDEQGTKLVFCKNTPNNAVVECITFGKKWSRKTITEGKVEKFHGFEWNKKGTGVAFFKQLSTSDKIQVNNVLLYAFNEDKLFEYNSEEYSEFPSEGNIVPFGSHKLKVAEDLENVFFAVNVPLKKNTASSVQIWAGNAPWIYPQQEIWTNNNTAKTAVWFPKDKIFKMVTDEELPWMMLTGDDRYAVVANPKAYEPQFEVKNGPMDYYIMHLKSGKKELLLKKQSSYPHVNVTSPAGKFITYFREAHWWVYNIKDKTHRNLTAEVPTSFITKPIDRPVEATAIGLVGWTPNDETVIVYDEWDAWEINPITGKANRLTNGYKSGIRFRYETQNVHEFNQGNYDGKMAATINRIENCILTGGFDDGAVGIFSWSHKNQEKELFKVSSKLRQIIRKGEWYIYKEENWNNPPVIKSFKPKSGSKTLVQSNSHHSQYEWPRMEVIKYMDAKGNPLEGLLYYPTAYDAAKKYPMIVHIYEQQSKGKNSFIVPEKHSSEGFNAIDYATNGYFVFFPDITYEIGNLGYSAVDCTLAGTKAVIKMNVIDENKIGLIGHSFGGYETDFIVTQTNLFATAVAGSAVTDMRSFYLTYSRDSGKPDMWRFENQQWRMRKSYFEDKKGYENNSPLNNVEKITTPLLAWTGNQDGNVDWKQSIDFYLALRRLNKKHVLLLYNGEGHVLLEKENQMDLSERIRQWFAHFLKEEKSTDWITDSLK